MTRVLMHNWHDTPEQSAAERRGALDRDLLVHAALERIGVADGCGQASTRRHVKSAAVPKSEHEHDDAKCDGRVYRTGHGRCVVVVVVARAERGRSRRAGTRRTRPPKPRAERW